MPRQYGKRSRAAYNNPVDIFGSPRDDAAAPLETSSVIKDEQDNLIERRNTRRDSDASLYLLKDRKPLRERNGNATLHIKLPTKARSRKKVQEIQAMPCRPPIPSNMEKGLVELVVAEDGFVATERNAGVEINEKVHAGLAAIVGLEDALVARQIPGSAAEICSATIPVQDATLASCTPDVYTTHCKSLLDLTIHDICSFTDWASQLDEHFILSKIAEASFGEVYRLALRPDLPDDQTTVTLRSEESVLKVIALKAPDETLPTQKREREKALKKAAGMSKVNDVAEEVKLLQRLSSIPGYTNFRDVRVLSGAPAEPFIGAWKEFNFQQKMAKKDASIFPDPAKKNSYCDTQLWAVIEMQDAGTDLERLVERGECRDIWTIWDIFWQVVIALAKGEEAAEFEHRDLHLGNICVRTKSTYPDAAINLSKTLGFTANEASLIDYTISRASMGSSADAAVAFIDLSNDEHIFNGDSTTEYQYDIYRYMRNAVYSLHPEVTFPIETLSTHTPWQDFHPITNLMWLHYVLYTLLEQIVWPSASKVPPRKRKPQEFKRWKRANDLEFALLRVQELLFPNSIGANGVGRASDLVGLALQEGWLREEDVIGDVSCDAVEAQDGVIDGVELAEKLGALAIETADVCVAETEAVVVPDLPVATTKRKKTRTRK